VVASINSKHNTLKDSYSKEIYSKSLDSREFKQLKENIAVMENKKSLQNLINVNNSLIQTNPEEALKNCFKGDSIKLIKFIEKLGNFYLKKEIENFYKISEEIQENLIENLLFLLEKGEFIIIITSWLKNIIKEKNTDFKQRTWERIKETLSVLSENQKKYNYPKDFQKEINEMLDSLEKRKMEFSEKVINE
jgi:hypothetical protein